MKGFRHAAAFSALLIAGCGGGGGGDGGGVQEQVKVAQAGGIPQNAIYEITITGGVSVVADLVVLPTIAQPGPPLTNNGLNPVDVAIFTRVSPIVGEAGALWFGTNTSLSALKNSNLEASNVDIAFVEANPEAGAVLITVDGNAFGLPTARLGTMNIYNLTTGVTAQIHNVLAGQIVVQFADGGQTVSGEIALVGSSGFAGPTPTSEYRAVFGGVRVQ